MRIAIIKGSSIGDFITSVPALRALKKKHPTSEITFITSYKGAGYSMVKNCPYIKEVILYDPKNPLNSLLRIASLRKKYFDIIIDGYPNTKKTSLLTFYLKGKIKASYNNPRNPLNFIYNVIVDPGKKTAIELEKEILGKIGLKYNDTSIEFFLPENKKEIRKKMEILGIRNYDKIVCIYLGKDDNFNRTWVNKNWADLINMIGKKYKFVLIGGRDNEKNGKEVENLSKEKIYNIIGAASLEETIYLIKKCSIFIGVNGGPMHIAAAFKKPSVVINGPIYRQWYPNNKRAINMGGRKLCSKKCNDNYCFFKDARCIKTINAKEVYQNAKKL